MNRPESLETPKLYKYLAGAIAALIVLAGGDPLAGVAAAGLGVYLAAWCIHWVIFGVIET